MLGGGSLGRGRGVSVCVGVCLGRDREGMHSVHPTYIDPHLVSAIYI